jgi:hypothetical protein
MIFEMTHDTICHSIRLITHSKARGMIRIPGRYCIAAGLAAALAVGATPSALAQWKPDRMTELIVSVAPGGNQDITARTIQSIWQERKILSPVNVINKPGGGGAIAYTHMSQRTKDPSQLLILADDDDLQDHGRRPVHASRLHPDRDVVQRIHLHRRQGGIAA